MSSRERSVRVQRPTPQQTSAAPGAGLTPSAVEHLQRSIGNRAVGRALSKAAGRRTFPGTRPVQRVGGEKIGFNLPPPADATIDAGQTLLLAQWRQVRQTEHNLKVGAERLDIEGGALEYVAHRTRNKAREAYKALHVGATRTDLNTAGLAVIPAGRTGGAFSQYYFATLTGRSRTQQLALLRTAPAFADARLTVDDASGVIQYRPDDTQPYVTIGSLVRGDAAFTVKTAATPMSANQRDILEKQGVGTDLNNDAKEYVKDTRGVLTRRYAYVEKNYWQMMEFFMTSHHEGRFQSFMKAAGEAHPDLFEARQPEVDIVRGQALPSTTGRLTKKQLAVAHQKLGSGPQQRGVSLASTPKIGATYVNTGENFRTAAGFRLKIDLALIPHPPAGPLLINHYGHHGVSDKPAKFDTTRERGKPSRYPYKESALHARELYLEYLKPEWIVAIESHPTVVGPSTTVDTATPRGMGVSLFAHGKAQFGGDSFERGFDEGLGIGHNTAPADPDHTKGFGHARSFVRGWTAGHAEHTRDGANDAAGALAAHITVPQYVYDKSMAVDLPPGEYDIYRMGYIRGRSGAALIATGANLPH
jgi:hypothetical protein